MNATGSSCDITKGAFHYDQKAPQITGAAKFTLKASRLAPMQPATSEGVLRSITMPSGSCDKVISPVSSVPHSTAQPWGKNGSHGCGSGFPDDSLIHYNLACYACRQGRLNEAKERLAKAIALDPQWRESALEDDDLEGIW